MSRNTGLLTEMCDPYGMESAIRLVGGLYAENMAGKHKWFCGQRADAGTFRLICTGGDYGFRRANDGGLVQAYHCDGGHEGPPMALCRAHVRELSRTGSNLPYQPLAKPWHDANGKEQWFRPGAVIGGTSATQGCPACACMRGVKGGDGEARGLMEQADRLQQQMSQAVVYGLLSEFARIQAQQDQVTARLNELHESGRIHNCPMKLVEVS